MKILFKVFLVSMFFANNIFSSLAVEGPNLQSNTMTPAVETPDASSSWKDFFDSVLEYSNAGVSNAYGFVTNPHLILPVVMIGTIAAFVKHKFYSDDCFNINNAIDILEKIEINKQNKIYNILSTHKYYSGDLSNISEIDRDIEDALGTRDLARRQLEVQREITLYSSLKGALDQIFKTKVDEYKQKIKNQGAPENFKFVYELLYPQFALNNEGVFGEMPSAEYEEFRKDVDAKLLKSLKIYGIPYTDTLTKPYCFNKEKKEFTAVMLMNVYFNLLRAVEILKAYDKHIDSRLISLQRVSTSRLQPTGRINPPGVVMQSGNIIHNSMDVQ